MENKKTPLSPLQLMQRFYNDYSKQKQFSTTMDEVHCKYARKKSATTDKLTKFLNQHDKRQRGNSTIVAVSSTNKIITQSGSIENSRTKPNPAQQSKRCYFKSNFSQSHPFLVTQHKIHEKQLPSIGSTKTQPIEIVNKDTIYKNCKFMNPTEYRNSIQDMKQKISKMKINKKQQLDKIRYNYLVNNCYKGHLEKQGVTGFGSKIRIRGSDVNTRQRIFPSSSTLQEDLHI